MSALESYARELNTSGAIQIGVPAKVPVRSISALARPRSAIFTVFSLVSLNGTRNNIQKRAVTVHIFPYFSQNQKWWSRGPDEVDFWAGQ